MLYGSCRDMHYSRLVNINMASALRYESDDESDFGSQKSYSEQIFTEEEELQWYCLENNIVSGTGISPEDSTLPI